MSNRFVSIFGGSVAMLAASGSAFAADIPAPIVKAPPAAVVATNWTGFYAGGNVGYGWGRARTDVSGNTTFLTFPDTLSAVIPDVLGFATSAGFAGGDTAHVNGIIGGGQIGYNLQVDPKRVWGIEADFQASGQKGSGAISSAFSATGACIAVDDPTATPATCTDTSGTLVGTAGVAYTVKLDWFGTVRGRFGYLVDDRTLVYVTGGLAYGRLKVSGASTSTAAVLGTNTVIVNAPGAGAFDLAKTKYGFAVGGGIEGRPFWLPFNWSWKVEYLYIDLGSLDIASSFTSGPLLVSGAVPVSGTVNTHIRFSDHIARIGLNYLFN